MNNLIISTYNKLKSINKTAKVLKIGTYKISKVLHDKKLVIKRTNHRKSTYFINENIFKDINNEYSAYILGFIYADGCLSEERNTLSITLKRSDKEHLENINKCMFSNYPIKDTTGRYSKDYPITEKCNLSICNKEIKRSLLNIGCSPRKSNTLTFPNLNQNIISHFMRGYFDGDGTVYVDNTNKLRFGLISTKEFCESYLKYLNLFDVVTIHKEKRSDKNVYYFTITKKKDLENIYKFLYKDSTLYLNRKKNIFDKYI